MKSNAGTANLPITSKNPEGIRARAMALVMIVIMALVSFFRLVTYRVTKRLPDTARNHDQSIPEAATDETPKEEFRPPSPTPAFTEANVVPTVLKRLSELEEKVDTLQSKPNEMPHEKEELLNAAVCRVDALEAELIATKKV